MPAATAALRAPLVLFSLLALVGAALVSAPAAAPDKDRQAPSMPKELRVAAATHDSVTLAWEASEDDVAVAGYYVFGDRGRQIVDKELSKPKHTVRGLRCGASLPLDVIAFDASQNRSEKATAIVSSAACLDMSPPTAPTGFAQAATSTDGVVLTWKPASDDVGVVGYGVYRSVERVASPTEPSVALSGLACGTSYEYAVDAVDAAGNRSHLARVWVRTSDCPSAPAPSPSPPPPGDTQAPSAPTGLTASNVAQTSVTLAWNASTDNVGVVGYEVFVDAVKVASPAETTANVTGLACSSSYVLGVQARDAAGNVSQRTQVNVTTAPCSAPSPSPGDTQAPTMPGSLRVSTATSTTVALLWDASADDVGVAGYRTYRDGTLVSTGTQTSSTVEGLACGTAYAFEVSAFDAAGNTSPRASVIGSTVACADTSPPSAPANVVASSRTATSIALTWSVSSDDVGVVGYGLYKAGASAGTTASTSWIYSSLTCGTSYTLAVDAYDAAGNRSPKTTVMVSTTACPDTSAPSTPTELAAKDVTQTSLTLTWKASTDDVGVVGYDVYLNGTKSATVSSTSASLTGLTCGTSYTLGVVARDAAGNSSSQASLQVPTASCDWTFCANEGQLCPFTGTLEVRYGANGTYTTPRAFTDGVMCTNDVFGDPLVGVSKHCETRPASSDSPPLSSSTWSAPITITQGGTYSGSWSSDSDTPAVTIATDAPVVIRNSRIRNTAGGDLIKGVNYQVRNLTVESSFLYGGTGRIFDIEGFEQITVRNCTIDKTSGMKLSRERPGATVLVTRNKQRNIQGPPGYLSAFFKVAEVQNATIEVSWNEIINEYDKSHPEDIISIFKSANARIHNNYMQHNSTPGNAYNTSSQGTITLDYPDGVGPVPHDNEIYDNQMVDTVNAVHVPVGAYNNSIYGNRLIQDGKLPDGTRMGNGYAGWSILNGAGPNNHMHGNVSGYVNRDGVRHDWYEQLAAPEGRDAEIANNTTLSGPITAEMEQAEWTRWLEKLAAAGITVGA